MEEKSVLTSHCGMSKKMLVVYIVDLRKWLASLKKMRLQGYI